MKKRIVVTIHGIRWKSKSDWQNRLGIIIKDEDPGIKVLHLRYGRVLGVASYWISMTRFLKLGSWIRARYVGAVRKFLVRTQKEFPGYSISVIAHSFGGWLLEQALQKEEDIQLGNVLFVHCPISAHIEQTYFWNWLERGRIKNIFSWSSHKDMVIGRVAIPPFGQNGYWGFIRQNEPMDRKFPETKPYPINLINTHTNENHGGVLNNLKKYGAELFEQLTS